MARSYVSAARAPTTRRHRGPDEQARRNAINARLTRAFDGLGPELEAFGRELCRRVDAGEPWLGADRIDGQQVP